MTPEKLIDVAATLGGLVDLLERLPESKHEAAVNMLMCSLVQNLCFDLAKSMTQNPDDPYAALVQTVNGLTEWSDTQKMLAKILLTNPAKLPDIPGRAEDT
ncbi:hypothetical protein ACN9MU_16525 [Pseudoduganella sp. R-32]|uniref:hypothetical protein n=1 Tax=Pseudoduganella sp. R-32 TaxID=3404061 RepID=UPI003CEDBD5D